MNKIAKKCVAAARNVVELINLIYEGKDPKINKTYYEFGAVLRTMVEELKYYNSEKGDDFVVSVREIYELADAIESLDKPSTGHLTKDLDAL